MITTYFPTLAEKAVLIGDNKYKMLVYTWQAYSVIRRKRAYEPASAFVPGYPCTYLTGDARSGAHWLCFGLAARSTFPMGVIRTGIVGSVSCPSWGKRRE